MAKKEPMSLGKKITLAIVSLAIGTGLAIGTRQLLKKQPKYHVGDCLVLQPLVYAKITEIKDGRYVATIQMLVMKTVGSAKIEDVDSDPAVVQVDCGTGEPLEEDNK